MRDEIALDIATEEDMHLPQYDHTKLSAHNMCPAWGIIRYGQHKTVGGRDRELALEAGEAAHQVFAAMRLYTVLSTQSLPDHAVYHGQKHFGADRFTAMLESTSATNSPRTNAINFGLSALNTSGYYDDPSDKKRTLANLTDSCIAYIDNVMSRGLPVWIEDREDPTKNIGIEQSFNIVVSIGGVKRFRFVGKIDGLHVGTRGLVVEENKTGARIDDAWLAQWRMSHQITGYYVAAALVANAPIAEAAVVGLALPLPRDGAFSGLRREIVARSQTKVDEWLSWLLRTQANFATDMAHFENGHQPTRYTHSCNRYFRPCSMLPYCDETNEERKHIFAVMEDKEWNPLNEDT